MQFHNVHIYRVVAAHIKNYARESYRDEWRFHCGYHNTGYHYYAYLLCESYKTLHFTFVATVEIGVSSKFVEEICIFLGSTIKTVIAGVTNALLRSYEGFIKML